MWKEIREREVEVTRERKKENNEEQTREVIETEREF